MSATPIAVDVDAGSFQREVIDRSHEVPVLVDFWAPWCAPCRSLGPVLENVVRQSEGRLALAKIDTDKCQELAGHFGIRSLPTVFLFKNGAPVDQFMGAVPESKVRAFVEPHLSALTDTERESARALAQSGDNAGAAALLREAIERDPNNLGLYEDLGQLLFEAGHYQDVLSLLGGLSDTERFKPTITRLRHLAEFGLKIGQDSMETLSARITDNPEDYEAELKVCAHRIVALEFEPALERLLGLLKSKSPGKVRETAAGDMRAIFEILGNGDPLVRTYRSKMSALLH